jgi:hypothetical protein
MKRRNVIATGKLYGQEGDEEVGWVNCDGADLNGCHKRNWSVVKWTATLVAIPGIGWLVYETVKASGVMLQ